MTETYHRLDLNRIVTLAHAFQDTVRRAPDRVALRTLEGKRQYTWAEYDEQVRRMAGALAGNGLRSGDRVGLMTVNGPDFHFLDTAALHLGVVPVSLYWTLPPEQIAWILSDAEVRVILAEAAFIPLVSQAQQHMAYSLKIFCVDDDVPQAGTMAEFTAVAPADFDFDAAWQSLDPAQAATVSYTSGTTGNPKGVVLSHRALLGSMNSLDEHFGTLDGGRVVSFLPFAHVAERMFTQYRGMAYGLEVTSCPDPRLVVQYLIEARPHYVFSPPRLFEKLRAAIERKMLENVDGKAEVLRAALDVGLEKVDVEQRGEEPDAELLARYEKARTDVLTPVLATLGLDQVKVALTGSAMVAPDLVRFFLAFGLPASEGWGMSECAAFGCFNRPGDARVGTCGRPLPGVELQLAEDGEILMRSPWLMTEYLNRPELTAETIDPDGWLHTGDIGKWVDGRLRIIDRKKELIINAFGKNMSPANIEAALKSATPLIGQAVVIGDARPYNVALVVLDPEVAAAKFAGRAIAELAEDEAVRKLVAQAVETANATLSRVEQVKRFALLGEEWLPGGDELSPTMKLKRRPINDKYGKVIEDLYAEQPGE